MGCLYFTYVQMDSQMWRRVSLRVANGRRHTDQGLPLPVVEPGFSPAVEYEQGRAYLTQVPQCGRAASHFCADV